MKLLKRLRQAWHYAKAADKKEQLVGVPIKTRIAGMALVNGLLNREHVCRLCFSRYTPKQREFAEKFQVRAILRIPDCEPDPMYCDACFETTVSSYNRLQTNVGTSNCGPPNLALRRLIAKE